MLKITSEPGTDLATGHHLRLRLEGRVAGPWVSELRRVCGESPDDPANARPPLILDMSGVTFVDPSGVRLLRELVDDRASITNCSLFVTEQLKGMPHDDQ